MPDPLGEPQTVSLLGEGLWAMGDTAGIAASAGSALAEVPADLGMWKGSTVGR